MTARATEDALHCWGGVYLAQAEDGTWTLWPRALYPSIDDALEAHWIETDHDGWYDEKARLTWAVRDHRNPGYWRFGDDYRESWEAVECWLVIA